MALVKGVYGLLAGRNIWQSAHRDSYCYLDSSTRDIVRSANKVL